jgi:anti-repressor protein
MQAIGKGRVYEKDGKLWTTSRDVAEEFEKEHKVVLKAIENLECSQDFSRHNFVPSDYINSRGQTYPMFELTRDGFMFLVMGFTGAKAAKVVRDIRLNREPI